MAVEITLNGNWQNVARYDFYTSAGFHGIAWIDAKIGNQDVTNNRTRIYTRLTTTVVQGSCAGSGYNFTCDYAPQVSGSAVWTFENETITETNSEQYVYHNADGTKSINLNAYVGNSYHGFNIYFSNASSTYPDGQARTIKLPTIPRASQPSCITYPTTTEDIGNIGDTILIHMNRKSTSFTHTVKYTFGNLKNVQIATGVTDNCEWTIPDSFYAQIPNSNVGSGSIKVDTYNGNTYIGTKTVAFKCNVTDSNPEFDDFDYEEIETTSLTGSTGKFIKGYSDVKITISNANKAVGVNGATITNYQTYIGSANKKYNGTIQYPLNYTVENVDSPIIITYAIDSRGNSTPVTRQAELIDYTPISYSNFKLERTNNISKETRLKFNGKIDLVDFGFVTNAIKYIRYFYKKVGQDDSAYVLGNTALIPTVDANGNISINQLIDGDLPGEGFNQNYAYVVKLEIIDELLNVYNEKFICTETLGSGSPAQAIKGNCTSLGMPYDETQGGRVQLCEDAWIKIGNQFYKLSTLLQSLIQ